MIACSGSSGERQLLVSAAASLTDAFAEVEAAFDEESSLERYRALFSELVARGRR